MVAYGSADDASRADARVARTHADVSRVALNVLMHEGSESLTHAHVAKAAGYSKTTLYTHWPSRVDLLRIALESLSELPHHDPTGDFRTDLVGELTAFRTAVSDLKLDKIFVTLSQWGATADEIVDIRRRLVIEGERPMRELLATIADGPAFDAAIAMIDGVVICSSLMYDTLPSDEVIAAAVDIVVAGLARR